MKTMICNFRRATLTLTLVASFVLISGTRSATGQTRHYGDALRAVLVPFNQVPSVLAPSIGIFEAKINDDGTISFSLSYANMTSSVVQAHIHFGASRTNGGVMVFLCGGAKPACPASGTITGTITAADVSTLPATSADSVIPQGIQPADLNGMIEAIRSGNTYVNVHTATFPGGEIRGQVEVY